MHALPNVGVALVSDVPIFTFHPEGLFVWKQTPPLQPVSVTETHAVNMFIIIIIIIIIIINLFFIRYHSLNSFEYVKGLFFYILFLNSFLLDIIP